MHDKGLPLSVSLKICPKVVSSVLLYIKGDK